MRFVWRYFHNDKPIKHGIKRIYCIDQIDHKQAFEMNLPFIEREAITFKPTWNQEFLVSQRAKVIDRWKESVEIFSPFNTKGDEGRRKGFKEVKILPLWQGSSKAVCDSIDKSGFSYFGKTSVEGYLSESTYEGCFGSGIYFTDSARYASDIYSEGSLLLAWISMREPFPVVGDPNQKDMKALYAKGAYKDYNAHYVPVTSIKSF